MVPGPTEMQSSPVCILELRIVTLEDNWTWMPLVFMLFLAAMTMTPCIFTLLHALTTIWNIWLFMEVNPLTTILFELINSNVYLHTHKKRLANMVGTLQINIRGGSLHKKTQESQNTLKNIRRCNKLYYSGNLGKKRNKPTRVHNSKFHLRGNRKQSQFVFLYNSPKQRCVLLGFPSKNLEFISKMIIFKLLTERGMVNPIQESEMGMQ